MHGIKLGIARLIKDGIEWPPNLPQFVKLCEPDIDSDRLFDLFISHKPPEGMADYLTRNQVGFRCRTQLSEDKARKLWSDTLLKNIKRIKDSGESMEVPHSKRIDAPTVQRERLTPEQRNQQLDAEIEKMLKSGHPLIGPYKQRYEETR